MKRPFGTQDLALSLFRVFRGPSSNLKLPLFSQAIHLCFSVSSECDVAKNVGIFRVVVILGV